jgi:CO/xanthine dehydrogenase Mo-binding subunit
MSHAPNTEGKYKWIGTRPDRPDGADKVTGRARFGADFSLPGQLIGKVLRSPHAHAVVKSIDTSKAEALNGVKAVITAKDFPDQPNRADRRDAGEHARHHAQHHGAREGAL